RKGKKIRVRGNVTNLLPGSPLLKADPIELQGKAIKNGKSKYRKLAEANTDASGNFKLRFKAKRTIKVRIFFPTVLPDLNVSPLIAAGTLQSKKQSIGKVKVAP